MKPWIIAAMLLGTLTGCHKGHSGRGPVGEYRGGTGSAPSGPVVALNEGSSGTFFMLAGIGWLLLVAGGGKRK